jgi:hypothetical protein
LEELRELRPIRSRRLANSVAKAVELDAEFVVLPPQSLNLHSLGENQLLRTSWPRQPIRFWNPGRRRVHHRKPLSVMQAGIELHLSVQRGRFSCLAIVLSGRRGFIVGLDFQKQTPERIERPFRRGEGSQRIHRPHEIRGIVKLLIKS